MAIDTYWVAKTKLQEFNPFGYKFIYLGVLDPSDLRICHYLYP